MIVFFNYQSSIRELKYYFVNIVLNLKLTKQKLPKYGRTN